MIELLTPCLFIYGSLPPDGRTADCPARNNARDLWRQQDPGMMDGAISATIPRHGTVLVRIAAAVQ
ncbi:MAG: hypothetical protein NTW21_11205 [Verrucomicrobia bacterium]|nr:hypothetical protein [Verrucomicrobiota bacterium]